MIFCPEFAARCSNCSVRKQATRSLVAFTFRIPYAFRVMHKGTLCMAFRTLALRVLNAHFFRVVRAGTLSRRRTSSANNIAFGCPYGGSSSRLFVTATSFSFALRFQICNSSAVTLESHGSEFVPSTKTCAFIALPRLSAGHPLHAVVTTWSFAKMASFVLAFCHPLALETYLAANPMRWCNRGWRPRRR